MQGSVSQKEKHFTWHSSYWRINLAAMLAFGSLTSAFSPTLSLYARDLSISPFLLGIVFSLPRFWGAFLRIPAGSFSTLIGRKKVLLAGGSVCIFAPLLLTLPLTGTLLFFIAFLYGFANLYAPAAVSLVNDVVPKEKRSFYLGRYSMWNGLGRALGPLFAGFVIDFTGAYKPVFYICSFMGLCSWLLTLSIPSPKLEEKEIPAFSLHFFQDLKRLFQEPKLFVASFFRGLQSMAVGCLQIFFPWYGRGVAGLLAGEIGTIQASLTLSSLIPRAFPGFLKVFRARISWMVFGTFLSGLCIIGLFQFTSFLSLLIIFCLIGLAEGFCHVAGMVFVSETAGEALFGAAIGMYGSMGDLGNVLGRILPGLTLPLVPVAFHFTRTFGMLGGGICLASFLLPLLTRFRKR